MAISGFTLRLVGSWATGQTPVRRVISRDVSRTVASRRGALELLGVRLDLRAVGSRASGETAKERRLTSITTRCESTMKTARCVCIADRRGGRSAVPRIFDSIRRSLTNAPRHDPAKFRNALILMAPATNAHLRNVQPSLQQHIACNLRDVATTS